MSIRRIVAGLAVWVGIGVSASPVVLASDHNEPAADAVWRADQALHKEWDISDLFAWQDRSADRLNVIVAWHPQQLPRDPGQQTQYSDQVLYTVHLRYERKGVQLVSARYLDREITVRYGANDAGQWGMLVTGLPGLEPLVLDCDDPKGWRAHAVPVGLGDGDEATVHIATGAFDDPFVFDLDGYNASLRRAQDGVIDGLAFDPQNDTFEGHNITAFVLSIPMEAFESHWDDFDPSGLLATEKVHVWATTRITETEVRREAEEEG